MFFFASRRRHTRWPRDWSSDVCSSDLNKAIANILFETADLLEIDGQDSFRIRSYRNAAQAIENHSHQIKDRSEERRVGKECRSRWFRCPIQKSNCIKNSTIEKVEIQST